MLEGLEIMDAFCCSFPKVPQIHTEPLASLHITHFFPTQVWRAPESAPHFADSLEPVAGLLPLPPSSTLHFEGWFLLPCSPWHRLNARGRKEVGGAARGRAALTLCWLVTLGVGTAKWRLRMRVGMLRVHRPRRLAGLSLPSPCLLPNESSHTTLEWEGEGHSFIYITQEISQSTSINHDHYPKSYKIMLLTASAARWLHFVPFLFPVGKKGGNHKIVRSNPGSPK